MRLSREAGFKLTNKMPTKTVTTKTKVKKAKKTKAEKPAKVKTAKKIEEKENKPVSATVSELAEETQTRPEQSEKYYEAVGRRKEATARVRVFTKKSNDNQESEDKALITINDKPYYQYFGNQSLRNIVDAPLKKLKSMNRFKATVHVMGGGTTGQADAIKFGLSRALVLFDQNFSKKLRKSGFLTRDAREKERRKYGLRKARKAPQWAKR